MCSLFLVSMPHGPGRAAVTGTRLHPQGVAVPSLSFALSARLWNEGRNGAVGWGPPRHSPVTKSMSGECPLLPMPGEGVVT